MTYVRPKIGFCQKYYVYALVDPRDGQEFYIGKGCGKRSASHVAQWRSKRTDCTKANLNKLNKIGEIHAAGMKVQVAILAENLTEPAAYRLERRRMKELRDAGRALTNIAPGARSSEERALQVCNDMIGRLRGPRQWMAAFLRREKRMVTADELALYVKVVRTLFENREKLTSLMQHGQEATA